MATNVIYKIRNMVNGKFYVGSAQDTRSRFRQHRRLLRKGTHHCKHLQNAWNKYGEELFKFEVIERVGCVDGLEAAEDAWLSKHFGKPYCYNSGRSAKAPWRGCAPEDHPNHGRLLSDDRKQVLREAAKRQWETSDPRTGRKHSEETKIKISEKLTGLHAGENHYRYGQRVSDDVRAKISAAQKGRPSPMKGKKMSEQGRRNVAAAAKRGPEAHAYGKRPTNADDLQRAIVVQFPNGSQKEFSGLSVVRDTFGVSIATLVRNAKNKTRITVGPFAGHVVRYADELVSGEPLIHEEIPDEYKSLPRTRTEAKQLGAKKYFTGQPCKNGHVVPRHTKGVCVQCAADEQRARSK